MDQPERVDEVQISGMTSGDRARVIEILKAHYSPENVLLTEPTPVEIYRERLQRYEIWEVVLWNTKSGQFLAWRRDGGLKARALVPDDMGRVGGEAIVVPGQGRPRPPEAPPVANGDVETGLEDEVTNELATQYLHHLEKALQNKRRGSLDSVGGSIGTGLRDVERSLRANREAEKQERRWETGSGGD